MAHRKPVRKSVVRKKPRPSAGPRKAAARRVTPIPPEYHTITPFLTCRNTTEAIAFYKAAFGAREKVRMVGPDGQSVIHAELQIGDSRFMLGDESPAMGAKSPQTLGGSSAGLMLYVTDVDKAYAKAVAAGATAGMPPANMFWGDRYGTLVDPFGHRWSLGMRFEILSPREMARRGKEWMQQQAAAAGAQS
jgi:PhnB protein